MRYFLLTIATFLACTSFAQGVLIGDTAQAPNPSAILELRSNLGGFLISRMTTTERNAVVNPAPGLQIYNTTTECFEAYYASVGWQALACACTSAPTQPGTISGFSSVCLNQQGVTYSISPVSGASSYTWTVPPGATIISGQGSVSIVVDFGASSGNIGVTASNSCGTSLMETLAVTAANPNATYTYLPTTPSVNNAVNFSAPQSGLTYSWTFSGGNPATSTAQNPSVTWSNSGTYTVTLTVTSVSGCSTTYSSAIVVSNCVTGGSMTFNATGAVQLWTVPAGVCNITIYAAGAQGGRNQVNNRTGGLGAQLTGTFAVSGGTQLRIIAGSQGQPGVSNPFGAGSGGGASAVSIVGQGTPLIVAGGGGGAGGQQGTYHNGGNAVVTTNGGAASPGGTSQGGTNGSGGTGGIGHSHCGAAGGGWLTAGTGNVSDAFNGQALSGSATGGAGGSYGISGGFGGGGGSNIAGGGGGGYSGGAGGDQLSGWIEYGGGGGGSFNSGTNQTNTPGAQTGNGQVIITW